MKTMYYAKANEKREEVEEHISNAISSLDFAGRELKELGFMDDSAIAFQERDRLCTLRNNIDSDMKTWVAAQ